MITVEKLLTKLNGIEVVTKPSTLQREVTSPEIARPGLSLVENSEYFPYERVLVFGLLETDYISKAELDEEHKRKILSNETPLIIFARGFEPSEHFIEICNDYNIAVGLTKKNTTKIISQIHKALTYELAPVTREHGVLLNVYGMGVLIKGASGIGKSEVALELVKKGHSLIADDSIIIRNIDDDELVGEAPDLLKNRIEIRGIGVIDIQKFFGITSVMPSSTIDLIVEFNKSDDQEFDRVGNAFITDEILDLKIKKIIVPVYPGRSLANLVEVAVSNYQLEYQYGYSSSQDFLNELNNTLKDKK